MEYFGDAFMFQLVQQAQLPSGAGLGEDDLDRAPARYVGGQGAMRVPLFEREGLQGDAVHSIMMSTASSTC
jgi:hypothetical protein